MSLRLRVFLGMAILLALTLLLGWGITAGGVLRPLFGKLVEERIDVAVHMARQVEASADPRRTTRELERELGVEARLGRRPPRAMAHRARVRERDGREILVLRAPGSPIAVPLEGSGPPRWLVITFPADLDAPGRKVALGLLALLALAVLGALLTSRWMLHPLEVASHAMRRVADGDLAHRAPTGADAAGQMGATFNRMAEQVEALVQGQRDLMAAVSHELRTPLARMRLQLAMLEDAGVADPSRLASLEADIAAMDGLVGELIESARLEQGVMALLREPVDLGLLCAEALGSVELGGRPVVFAVPDGLVVPVDRKRLSRVLANLLSNAVRYTPEDAELTLAAEDVGGEVCLRVSDRGPGVTAAELPRLFEPFFRAEGSRSRTTGGLGLGLMLVRQIAEAHGGRVRAEARSGGGLSISVWLPVEPEDGGLAGLAPADGRR